MSEPVNPDALGLTLPKAGRRTRARRRKRPSGWFWFYVAAAVSYALLAVWTLLLGHLVTAAVCAFGAGRCWAWAHRAARIGADPAPGLPFLGFISALTVALIVSALFPPV